MDLSATSAQNVVSSTASKTTEEIHNILQLDADVGRIVSESFDSVGDMTDMTINDISITELLSTCIDACRRGCEVIRNVRHKLVQSSNVVGSDSKFFCCGAVKYKISNDPRSALTEADEASQKVITECLNNCWAKEIRSGLIKVVGEEDEGDDDFVDSVPLYDMMAHFEKYNTPSIDQEPVQRDLLSPSDSTQILHSSNEKNELIIFIDPMDGTREFVENRIENVQCLIGITLNGKPIAGAVGMPMIHEDKIEIAYGIDLPADSEQATLTPLSKLSGVKYFNTLNPLVKQLSVTDTGMGDYIDGEDDVKKLVVLSGDSKKPALTMSMKCLESDVLGTFVDSAPPIRKIVAGGCGNKMLFVQRRFEALSERIRHQEGTDLSSIIGSISLAPPGSSSWDTAGPTALLLAADPNAVVTDLIGRPLVYDGEHLSNDCGVVVSAGHMATRIHREMCEKLRRDEVFCEALGVVRCNAEIT
mmetsp:Transcript_31467/g.63468  ORF Transcript_31467/g.63468 Transcript_31467/m.63468 type:complete len:474 (+) Transcript_31467:86-1507(+)